MLSEENISPIMPGVYDISGDDYHSGDGISRSGIMELKRSALHYWERYINPNRKKQKDTDALILGRALHTFILEPQKFNDEFYIAEKVNRTTKIGKAAWIDAQENAQSKHIIFTKDFAEINKMADSIKRDPIARGLVESARYEKSIYWIDKDTGLLCKCRPDIWHSNMICDLKTAKDASPYTFEYDIYNYGYHIQAAMMQDAVLSVLNVHIKDFFFIVVEKTAPYAAAVYMLDEDSIEKGREEYKHELFKYKKCLETNEWPGYQIKQVSIPRFAYYL